MNKILIQPIKGSCLHRVNSLMKGGNNIKQVYTVFLCIDHYSVGGYQFACSIRLPMFEC